MGGREQNTANRLMGWAEKTLAHSCKPAQGRASLSTWAAAAVAPSLCLSSRCVLTRPVPTGPPVPALHSPLLTSRGPYFESPYCQDLFLRLMGDMEQWDCFCSSIAHERGRSVGVGTWFVPCYHLSCWCLLFIKVTLQEPSTGFSQPWLWLSPF